MKRISLTLLALFMSLASAAIADPFAIKLKAEHVITRNGVGKIQLSHNRSTLSSPTNEDGITDVYLHLPKGVPVVLDIQNSDYVCLHKDFNIPITRCGPDGVDWKMEVCETTVWEQQVKKFALGDARARNSAISNSSVKNANAVLAELKISETEFANYLKASKEEFPSVVVCAAISYDLQQYADVVDALGSAVVPHDDETTAQVLLGQSLLNLGKVEESMEAFQKGLEKERTNADLCLGLGTCLMQLHRLDEAAGYLQDALNFGTSLTAIEKAGTKVNLANVLQERKDFLHAIALFQEVLPTFEAEGPARVSDVALIRGNLANAFAQSREFGNAQKQYALAFDALDNIELHQQSSRELKRKKAYLLENQARAYWDDKDNQKALSTIDKAIGYMVASKPDDYSLVAKMLLKKGDLYKEISGTAGNLDSTKSYEKAKKLLLWNGQSATDVSALTSFKLGENHYGAGKLKRSEEDFFTVIDIAKKKKNTNTEALSTNAKRNLYAIREKYSKQGDVANLKRIDYRIKSLGGDI